MAAGRAGEARNRAGPRRDEEALHGSEQDFRLMANAAPVLIWTSDRDMRCNWFNRQWLEFVGRPLEQEVGDGWIEHLHPDDRDRCLQVSSSSFQTREPFSIEYRLRRHDGEYRWVLDHGVPRHGADGEFAGYIGSCIDLTERKQAETAQQHVYALAESSEEFIGMCDLALKPFYINMAGLQMVGLESLEQVEEAGILAKDFFFPEDQEFIRREFLPQVLREGQGELEIRFRHFRSGEPVWVIYSVVVLIDENGAPVGFGTVSRNITERRRVEHALREADRRKDEFLATLAHELRNPLAPIRNSLEILKRADDDVELLRRSRDTIERQLGHMVRLVDDLLDVSRITRDKIELRRSRVELKTVLSQAVETVRPLIEEKQHALEYRLPETPLYLEADPVRLAQIFSNLLNNACKFMESGGRITVRAEQLDGEAVVAVGDSGPGIEADKIDNIFEMFSQVDTSLSRSSGGLGIGLTLVKRLVEMHGGQVAARSEGPGKGSEFTVRLPAMAAVAEAASEDAGHGAGESLYHRILVVDDNRDGAESLAMLLRMNGHDTRLAYDGFEAVEAARQFRPQLILLDIGLPGLNGFDACRRIRSEDWGRDIMMVALTGWGQDQDRRKSREAGLDAHLVKPVDYQALIRLLAELPARSQAGSDP